MAGEFLHTQSANVVRRLVLVEDMTTGDRSLLTEFLTMGDGHGYAPASGEIVGILKQMKDTMEKDLADIIEEEKKAKENYDALMEAKQKEVDSLTKAIEEKIKRIGELGVELLNMKEDLD